MGRPRKSTLPEPSPIDRAWSTGDLNYIYRAVCELRDREWQGYLSRHKVELPGPELHPTTPTDIYLQSSFTQWQVREMLAAVTRERDLAWKIWADDILIRAQFPHGPEQIEIKPRSIP